MLVTRESQNVEQEPKTQCGGQDLGNNWRKQLLIKICRQFSIQPTEPLIPTSFPQLPWQKVGVDLFTWKTAKYLLLIDIIIQTATH